MAHPNSFAKRERERRKKLKATEKRMKRQKKKESTNDAEGVDRPALEGAGAVEEGRSVPAVEAPMSKQDAVNPLAGHHTV